MRRRLALALLLLCAAFGVRAACPESGGIGGTGVSSEGGIGGTGIRPQSDLGIVGVITAFGSICVNNVEVQYDAATPVAAGGQPSSANALAIGQVVAVRATGDAQHARAQRIEILEAAVGRAEAFDAASGVFELAGQRVHLAAHTAFGGMTRETLVDTPPVRVSGLWRADGSLEATRVERAPDNAPVRAGTRDLPHPGGEVLIVEGFVRESGSGRVVVGGLEFRRESGAQRELRRDDFVRITARGQVVERAEVMRSPLDARPERGSDRGPGRPDRPERTDRPDRPDRADRPDRPERSDRPDRVDRSGRH